jgi:hypothetical protein
VITEHQFSAVPEGQSLRRRYTVVARHGSGGWYVEHLQAGYLGLEGHPGDDDTYTNEPAYTDEATAVARAEQAAPLVRAWTIKGVLTAAEAMEAGLR